VVIRRRSIQFAETLSLGESIQIKKGRNTIVTTGSIFTST
jgi:hypothetical protein